MHTAALQTVPNSKCSVFASSDEAILVHWVRTQSSNRSSGMALHEEIPLVVFLVDFENFVCRCRDQHSRLGCGLSEGHTAEGRLDLRARFQLGEQRRLRL
eukprot:3209719-Rhodomonas_salina.3